MLQVEINGKKVAVKDGETILGAAKKIGVKIPHLCHEARLKPYGACRLCLVEIEGERNLQPACVYQVRDGMAVWTDTEEVIDIRKTLLELLLSDHPTDCMTCEKCGECKLQKYAYQYGVRETPYKGEFHPVRYQEADPFVERNMEKCILCGRCVRICDEVEAAFAIDYSFRGFNAQVGAPFGRSLKETTCEFCGQCISTCPVGALIEKPRKYKGRSWELKNVSTICPYCGVGCTLELQLKDNQIVNVTAPKRAGINKGNLCVKGRFGYEFVSSPDRLKVPLIRKNDKFIEASWPEAIELISKKLSAIIKKYGPDAIAGLSSAKCTNEENFVFQKFIRATIGTNNVDHCARLCHASTVAGLATAFGSGAMTNSINDIKHAEVILVIGSNTTEAHPIIGIEVVKAVRDHGAKLIVIDPRQIKLTKFADIWLQQTPGTDVAVLNGLMNVILKEKLIDEKFIKKRTEDFDKLKAILSKYTPEVAEKISSVPAKDLRRAAKMFGETKAGYIIYAMGITQHTTGVDNVFAIANLAMMTGNIGREGAGVNPLRGQNNVQGGCDMGALPDVFSGYQKVSDKEARSKFEKRWGRKLSLKPGFTVIEMMQAAEKGKIKAMYIMGENPMLSDPDISHVEKALNKLDFLVVQDIFLTETASLADVVLPGVSFAERDGSFTNTERRVQRVRKAIEPVAEAKVDWQIICEISQALGYPMNYQSAADIMEEVAELTPSYAGINYQRLDKTGLQWPCPTCDHPGTSILHRDKFTRGLGKFHAVEYKPADEKPDKKFPLILTTGRVLTQYHTGTMIRRTAGIDELFPIARVEINPKDAQVYRIKNNDEITIASRRGKIKVKAMVTKRSSPGVIFMPFHFKEAAANILTNPALDSVAKIPELKVCAVRIERVRSHKS